MYVPWTLASHAGQLVRHSRRRAFAGIIIGSVRKFVQMWTTNDLAKEADSLANRNFNQGKAAFESTGCIKCHKIGDAGVNLGPDLTKVSERFKGGKLLQQMLEPSSEVNKQYQTWVAAMNDGRVIAGMLVEQTDDQVTLLPNPLKPRRRSL